MTKKRKQATLGLESIQLLRHKVGTNEREQKQQLVKNRYCPKCKSEQAAYYKTKGQIRCVRCGAYLGNDG